MPAALASGVFIGERGSWNRKPRSGYKVVWRVSGQAQTVVPGAAVSVKP